MYSLKSEETGIMTLPEELFGLKANPKLLAQAARVYLNNQKAHHSSTKTRGEVAGSTRKVYKQKGTGGARHGSIKAPIYVGGGIALGPKYRQIKLELPTKMKKAALLAALTAKLSEKEVIGVSGLEKASGKTKEMAAFLGKLGKKSLLLVDGSKSEAAFRAVRNLPNMEAVSADQLNLLQLLKYQTLMLTKEAVEGLEKRIKGGR